AVDDGRSLMPLVETRLVVPDLLQVGHVGGVDLLERGIAVAGIVPALHQPAIVVGCVGEACRGYRHVVGGGRRTAGEHDQGDEEAGLAQDIQTFHWNLRSGRSHGSGHGDQKKTMPPSATPFMRAVSPAKSFERVWLSSTLKVTLLVSA